ncbi:subtilisin-like protease SBT1.2 [Tanacetum coccineum]
MMVVMVVLCSNDGGDVFRWMHLYDLVPCGTFVLDGKPIVDERELPSDIFAIGVGHVNPSKANDPGLISDIKPDDYILYLCGFGYTTKQIRMIAKKTVIGIKSIPEAELNYPSFLVMLKRGDNKTCSKTVTNIGIPRSRYTIRNVSLPRGVRILVKGPS